MNDHLSTLKKSLCDIVEKLIKEEIVSDSFNLNNLSLDYLSKSKKGDVSSNLLILLRSYSDKEDDNIETILKKNIMKLDYIDKIEIAKAGFINFFFKKDYIISDLLKVLVKKKTYGENNAGNNRKINIEFVSANPTGPIHVAHIRGAVIGDVLASILKTTGHQVTREYYVNDSGNQVDILGDSLFKRYQECNGIEIILNENEYPGEYLKDIANLIFEDDKNQWLNADEKSRKKYFKNYAIKKLIDTIKKDLQSLNIIFDKYTYESKIIENKYIDKLFTILKEKNLLYDGFLEKPIGEENSDWSPRKQLLFKSTKFIDDKDRALKKANGEWTYFANDSAYHYDKFLRNFSELINVWGADHIGYINRMKSIVNVFSNDHNYLNIVICQIVRLIKDGKIIKMSKREGNFITLKDLLKQVDKDSLRYYMVSTKSETPMDFDLDRVIKKDKDNPVFYCQYAYARACSVINKSKSNSKFKNFDKNITEIDFSTLSSYEWQIILKILSWPYLLNQASHLKQPHRITNYLEDICSNFHSFWNKGKEDSNLRFLDDNDVKKTILKLIWINAFKIVLNNAFEIIGIESNEQM